MNLPENSTLTKKDIKHARIKVSEDGGVRIVVPFSFSEEDIEALLVKKQRWIEQKQAFFANKKRITLGRNQLLLMGNRYSYYYDTEKRYKVTVDDAHKTIRARRDLLDKRIQEKWYKQQARNILVPRTHELAERFHLQVNKIYIRSQRTKLGNCSAEKNISLNWRLIKAPEIVADYIIVHELVHTRVMNHTNKFWTLLKSLYPDYQAAINWIDMYGNSL